MEKITKSAGAMYLSRDDEAPQLYAIWLDGEILGAGDTSEEAFADARTTLKGWKIAAAQDAQIDARRAASLASHATDEDCEAAGTVTAEGDCTGCGVTGDGCWKCCGIRYHKAGCSESDDRGAAPGATGTWTSEKPAPAPDPDVAHAAELVKRQLAILAAEVDHLARAGASAGPALEEWRAEFSAIIRRRFSI